jgi:hypothetical protein
VQGKEKTGFKRSGVECNSVLSGDIDVLRFFSPFLSRPKLFAGNDGSFLDVLRISIG